MCNICKYTWLIWLLYKILPLKAYIFKKAQDFTEEILPPLFDVKDSFAIDFIWARISLHVF